MIYIAGNDTCFLLQFYTRISLQPQLQVCTFNNKFSYQNLILTTARTLFSFEFIFHVSALQLKNLNLKIQIQTASFATYHIYFVCTVQQFPFYDVTLFMVI